MTEEAALSVGHVIIIFVVLLIIFGIVFVMLFDIKIGRGTCKLTSFIVGNILKLPGLFQILSGGCDLMPF